MHFGEENIKCYRLAIQQSFAFESQCVCTVLYVPFNKWEEVSLRTHFTKRNKVEIPWLGGSTHRHSFYSVQILSFITSEKEDAL